MTAIKLATHLWFDHQAEEAATLYTGLLPDSSIDGVNRAGAGMPNVAPGDVFQVELTLMGQSYLFLNGGPQFPFSPVVSLFVLCDGQADVDHYWEALLADGGRESQCGWLSDRFGLSWQIVPRQLGELMGGPDPEVSKRVLQAMLGMAKLDVAALEAAARG